MNQSTEQQVKFNEFLKSLSAYYMDFLETDFKKRRLPCRRIVYRREDLLVGTPLYKYERLRKQLFDAIWDGFHSKRSIEVVRGRFAIKLSDDIKDAILDAVDSIDQKNFNLREFIRTVDIASGKSIPNKELFLKELEFQVEDLLKENSGTLDKEQVEEIFDSFVCFDFYDELYEIYKNKVLKEKDEVYIYFYDIQFKDNRYPIFYMPVILNRRKSDDHEGFVFDIEFGTQILINKSAIEFISQSYNALIKETRAPLSVAQRHLYIGDVDLRSEIKKVIDEACSFFKIGFINSNLAQDQKVKNEHVAVSNSFYVSLFDKSDESLLNDYEELMQLLLKGGMSGLVDIFAKLNNDFLLENPKVFNREVDDEYSDKSVSEKLSYQSPIPLNEEQQKIIAALRKQDVKNIVVEGPPGTGKSHTITAIIFHALLEHKTVLMASDKKEALDVVEEKITSVLDKIKKEDDFLQNPLLRLGKQETNYSEIFKQQNYEKINQRFNATRRHVDRLESDIVKVTGDIKDNIANDIAAYSSVDPGKIHRIHSIEGAIQGRFSDYISFEEAYVNVDFRDFLKKVYATALTFKTKEKLFESVQPIMELGSFSPDVPMRAFQEVLLKLSEAGVFIKKIASCSEDLNQCAVPLVDVLKNSKAKYPEDKSVNFYQLHEALDKIFAENKEFFQAFGLSGAFVLGNLIGAKESSSKIQDLIQHLNVIADVSRKIFGRKKLELELVQDITHEKYRFLEQYLSKIRNLRTFFFGLIVRQKELRQLNEEFLRKFPSCSLAKPHRSFAALEKELRLYTLFNDVDSWLVDQNLSSVRGGFWKPLADFMRNHLAFDYQALRVKLEDASTNLIDAYALLLKEDYFTEARSAVSFITIREIRLVHTVSRYLAAYQEFEKICGELADLRKSCGSHKKAPLSIKLAQGRDIARAYKEDFIDALSREVSLVKEAVMFCEAESDNLSYLNEAFVRFPKTLGKLRIVQGAPDTLARCRLTDFSSQEINGLLEFLNDYHIVSKNYDRLEGESFSALRDRLENKLVLKMTHILDNAVVKFKHENLKDQQHIRDLIRKKKQIPKELLRKLVEAFPCLIVNIRDLGEYLPLESEVFDIVIIDEASQVSIAQAFPAILRGKKVVVLGDKKQYSNVKTHNASIEVNNFLFSPVREAFQKYVTGFEQDRQKVLADIVDMFDVKRSILDFLSRVANYTCSLRKHFRGYRELISYSNKFFYSSFLQVMKIRSRPVDEVLNFYQLENDVEDDLYKNVNSVECDFIIEKLVELKEKEARQTVGIITPFTNQQRYIYGKVMEHPFREYFMDVMNLKVMTFDTCQGDEKDIIFYSFVEKEGEEILKYIFPRDLAALSEEEDGSIKAQRLNVGLSRSKEEIHFILSKDVAGIGGEIGNALRHYRALLDDSGKVPSVDQTQSEMEKCVLNYLLETDLYKKHTGDVEIFAQFELGAYLKQLYDIDIPKYRVDFMIVYRAPTGRPVSIIVEYDGYEFHFKDKINVGLENFEHFYVEKDIERQKTLESYGYSFIRLNRFIMKEDPVKYLDERLSRIIKNGDSQDPLINQVAADAEKIKNGHIKKCSKCGEYKDLSAFMERGRFTVGRYCLECKKKPTVKSKPIEIDKFIEAKRSVPTSGVRRKEEDSANVDFLIGNAPKNMKATILKAISDKGRIKIIYRSRYDRKTVREISPLSLTGDYMRAYCHLRKEERTFRLSSIKSIG